MWLKEKSLVEKCVSISENIRMDNVWHWLSIALVNL